jgi:hypothetical protein
MDEAAYIEQEAVEPVVAMDHDTAEISRGYPERRYVRESSSVQRVVSGCRRRAAPEADSIVRGVVIPTIPDPAQVRALGIDVHRCLMRIEVRRQDFGGEFLDGPGGRSKLLLELTEEVAFAFIQIPDIVAVKTCEDLLVPQ